MDTKDIQTLHVLGTADIDTNRGAFEDLYNTLAADAITPLIPIAAMLLHTCQCTQAAVMPGKHHEARQMLHRLVDMAFDIPEQRTLH